MIFKAFTQGTLVRERGPEARATGVRCTTRARGPRYWGTLVRQRGPEARATGVRWYVNAGRRPALLGALHNAGQRPALLGYAGT